jgi:NitT/TauT family transport system substrate-binding protein
MAITWVRLAMLTATVLCGMGGAAAWAADDATPVTLQLLWTHQAYFGGYYVADKQGFYAKEGLRVGFLEGGPNADLISPVLDGRAQFGVAAAAELLIARERGQPVRAIATIFRRGPTAYVAKAGSGIARPVDFVGRTVRVSTVDTANFLAMMSRAGVRRDQYTMVSLPSDVAVFASGAADVWSVYVNNFAVTLEQAGFKLTYIYPDDYGIHFYADTVFAGEQLIADRPDLVLRFLRASLKGWAIAVEQPRLVGGLVRSYDAKADSTLETKKMEATQTLVNTGEDQIGWMTEEGWTKMAGILEEQGLLAESQKARDAFTMTFLRQIYGAEPASR